MATRARQPADPDQPETEQLTLELSKKTIREARALAAQKGISLSALMEAILREKTHPQDSGSLDQQGLALLKTGFDMGGSTALSREELHER